MGLNLFNEDQIPEITTGQTLVFENTVQTEYREEIFEEKIGVETETGEI